MRRRRYRPEFLHEGGQRLFTWDGSVGNIYRERISFSLLKYGNLVASGLRALRLVFPGACFHGHPGFEEVAAGAAV